MLGAVSCPGKTLSMDVMRSVLGTFVKKYQWEFAPGETGADFVEGLIDHFTMSFGELNLSFRMRETK